jgi:DedD protein
MMATRSDAPDLAVDELRRRARRRLVGAIVLALAAAVLLPLLLESEPKPLGDDVSIQIPPIDSGKFINPLSSAKTPDPKVKGNAAGGKSAAPVPSALPSSETPPVILAPKTGAVESETRASAVSPSSAPALVATPSAAPETKTADARPTTPDTKPVAPVPGPEPKTDIATAGNAAPATSAKPDAAKTGAAFVVQVAAFSDRYGARSLVTKLKRGGFPGYTETVTTDKGTLHRVRVGPYASRDAADAALARLKAAGFDGMVAHVG